MAKHADRGHLGEVKRKQAEGVVNRVVNVADCAPNSRNYQYHQDSQIAFIAEFLRQFGQVRSIVVWLHKTAGKPYTLLAGHGVWQAAQRIGLVKLRADVCPASWSEMKALAYVSTDNELGRHGVDVDLAQLAANIRDIQQAEGDTLATLAAGEANAMRSLLAQANAGGKMVNPIQNEQWMVLIECLSEQEQSGLLQRFIGEGLKCRALVS